MLLVCECVCACWCVCSSVDDWVSMCYAYRLQNNATQEMKAEDQLGPWRTGCVTAGNTEELRVEIAPLWNRVGVASQIKPKNEMRLFLHGLPDNVLRE